MYIISCHVCQTFKNYKRFDKEPMNRRIIDINAPTLTPHLHGHKTHATFQG